MQIVWAGGCTAALEAVIDRTPEEDRILPKCPRSMHLQVLRRRTDQWNARH